MDGLIDKILELKLVCHLEEELGTTCGLSPREIHCISEVVEQGPLSSKDLSQKIHLSPSRGSRVVGRLVEKGLIQVHQNDQDRRAVELSITDKGKACFQAILKDKARCEERLLMNLTEEEQQQVQKGLTLLLKGL